MQPSGMSLLHLNQGIYEMKFLLTLLTSILLFGSVWAAGPINVNTATAEEIANGVKGIGPSKAQLIVEYREANGAFAHVDELVKVKGIGIKTVDRIRSQITLQDETTPARD